LLLPSSKFLYWWWELSRGSSKTAFLGPKRSSREAKFFRAVKISILVAVVALTIGLFVYDVVLPAFEPLLLYPDIKTTGNVTLSCALAACPLDYLQSVQFKSDNGRTFTQNISTGTYSLILPNGHEYSIRVFYKVNWGWGNSTWSSNVGYLNITLPFPDYDYDITCFI
jgi:hypothetical protein